MRSFGRPRVPGAERRGLPGRRQRLGPGEAPPGRVGAEALPACGAPGLGCSWWERLNPPRPLGLWWSRRSNDSFPA